MSEKTRRLLEELTRFYDQNGIHPLRFRCPSRLSCSANSPRFTEAKATFVGPRYGDGNLPRLLFLSLDSGSASSDPAERTPEAVRRGELETDVTALEKNRHWYRTHELAYVLLHRFKPDLTIADTWLYFAHANSAKCCQNKPGRSQADGRLFRNCQRFIPGELRVLDPDIIVTQGDAAMNAIRASFAVRQRDRDVRIVADALYGTGIIEPRHRKVLWLHTYHPGAWGSFNRQRRHCWRLYADAVERFWAGRE